MYEHKSQKPIHRKKFLKRLLQHLTYVFVLLLISIFIGMAGYMHYENLPWRDAFLNTAMLLGGMGPIDGPKSDGGKLFAGFFALYAGLVIIASLAVMVTPVVHRVMHNFHCKADDVR